MAEHNPKTPVLRFNDCINGRDVECLARLMTVDHEFIDTEEGRVRGKTACLDAWRGFFREFPDYQNIFEHVETRGDLVVVLGRSTCSEPQLSGPAIWTARVRSHLVAEWRVYADSADNRRRLAITAVSR